jgi:hypothetical protein
LLSEQDAKYKVSFAVDFSSLAYIGNDLTKIGLHDLSLIVFRITPFEKRNKREYYTTQSLFLDLMNKKALKNCLTSEVTEKRSALIQ